MRQSRAYVEVRRLEGEKELKLKGAARISLDVLHFKQDQPRVLNLKHVGYLKECFKKKGGRRLQISVPAIIDQQCPDAIKVGLPLHTVQELEMACVRVRSGSIPFLRAQRLTSLVPTMRQDNIFGYLVKAFSATEAVFGRLEKTICELVLLAYLPCMLVYADPVSKLKAVQYLTPNVDLCQTQIFGYEAIWNPATDDIDAKISTGRIFNASIRDTAGVVVPLDWEPSEELSAFTKTNNSGAPKVRSMGYYDKGSSNCKPIQVMFYDNRGFLSATRYVNLKNFTGWAFSKSDNSSTFAAYNGVTMLVPVEGGQPRSPYNLSTEIDFS
ncbi:hypothetical protein V493_01953 [Pseudogymnoascus sp. VKM F-4281 (FW-2241)]|nr:hypothetical protein V493_01953 [Pseudogymnoascus sp. VKM F-4281 (FW-2241)]